MNWAAFYYDYNDQQVFMNQVETPQMPPVHYLKMLLIQSFTALKLKLITKQLNN